MFGLYGDLPQAKDETEKKDEVGAPGKWSGSSLVPPAKRAGGAVMPPPAVLRNASGRGRGDAAANVAAGSASGGRGRGRGTAVSASVAAEHNKPSGVLPTAAFSGFGDGIRDEYDPALPNDYDEIRRRREQQRLDAEAESERQERLREVRELEELERRREDEVEREQEAAAAVGSGGGVSAPHLADNEERRVMLGLSGDEAFLRRAVLSSSRSTEAVEPLQPPASSGGGVKGMTLAQRMLEKMGWKEGEGLGKTKQGMAAPLAVQKTDARSGRVVSLEPIITAPAPAPPCSSLPSFPPISDTDAGPPSRVIVLRNIVPPGGVDDSLDEEVGNECSRHGEVTDVAIFEVTAARQQGIPDEEAVRVYVQFTEQGAAAAALMALHGRFFGGRTVRARYFDEARFEAGDLAPRYEELRS